MIKKFFELSRLGLNVGSWCLNSEKNTTKCLAIHGWLDNKNSFYPLASRLGLRHFTSIDLPGHGESSFLEKSQVYDPVIYLRTLHELLVFHFDRPVCLIGHSLGAALVSIFAGTFPELVSSLVLIDGIGPLSKPIGESPLHMRRFLESNHQLSMSPASIFPDKSSALNARIQVGELSMESARLLAEGGLKQVSGGFQWHYDRRLRASSYYGFTQPQVLAYLSKISCPSLFIRAKRSIIRDSEAVQQRLDAISNLELVELEGGHHLHMDQAETCSRVISNFLSEQNL